MLQLTKYFPDQKTDSKIRITKLDISNCEKKDGESFMLSVLLFKKKIKNISLTRLSF